MLFQAGEAFVDLCWLSDGRLVVASDRTLQIIEATEVVMNFKLTGSIHCLLALPDNRLVVSMGKVCMI